MTEDVTVISYDLGCPAFNWRTILGLLHIARERLVWSLGTNLSERLSDRISQIRVLRQTELLYDYPITDCDMHCSFITLRATKVKAIAEIIFRTNRFAKTKKLSKKLTSFGFLPGKKERNSKCKDIENFIELLK